MKSIQTAPFGIRWRQLWLPEHINGVGLPAMINGGLPHTLTGSALKRSTADGIHGDGSATSNMVVTAEAGFNNQAKFAIYMRFKFDQTFAAGVASQYICTKRLAADDYINIYFDTADGALTFAMGDRAGGVQFTLKSTTVSWIAGVWYSVILSLSDTGPAQRLLVNGVAEDTDTVAAINTPNGGDLVFLSSSDGGADGFKGTLSIAAAYAVDLTANQEADMTRGFPTAAPVYLFTCDNGRGTSLANRGSGANPGTLDSSVTWVFGKCRQAVMSPDGLTGYAVTAATANISGELTLVWVGKVKSAYNGVVNSDKYFIEGFIDNNNTLQILYNCVSHDINYQKTVAGATSIASFSWSPSIDDYVIFTGIVDLTGNLILYINGCQAASNTLAAALPAGAARIFISAEDSPANYDISRPLLAGIIETALPEKKIILMSKWINQALGLGLNL